MRPALSGPVLPALPFSGEDDAVRLANATEYRLVGTVRTAAGGRLQRLSGRIRCGQVFIGCDGAGAELPFGGVKRSGHGGKEGFPALEHMTSTRTVVHHHG